MAERIREIRAVYDGKVFVPKEEVDLPINTEASVQVEVPNVEAPGRSREALDRLFGMVDAPWYDPAKFSREDIYD
jgi:hypothetical protein